MAKVIEQSVAFALDERRILTIDGERIDAAYLTDGEAPDVEAVHNAAVDWPTHTARHYGLEIRNPNIESRNVRVQLNGGDAGGDETRLKSIVEDLLSTAEEGERL